MTNNINVLLSKNVARLIVGLVVISTFFSCSKQSNPIVRQVDQLSNINPDSALLLLSEVEGKISELNNNDRALYGLLKFRVMNKLYMELQPESLILNSIDYYFDKGDDNHLAECYFLLARMYTDQREYSKATRALLNGIEVCRKDNYGLLGKLYFSMGIIAGSQWELDCAMGYYNKAKEYFENAKDTVNITKVTTQIGALFMTNNDYKKAMQSYQEVISMGSDSITIGDTYDEIGFIYGLQSSYDSALYYYKKSLQYPFYSTNLSKRLYHIADTYYELQEKDSVVKYCNMLLVSESDIYFERECLSMLIDVETERGNRKAMIQYLKRSRIVEDSIVLIEQQSKLSDIEQIYHLKNSTVKFQHHRNQLIILIVVISIFGIWVIYRFVRKSVLQKDETKRYKDKLRELEQYSEIQKQELEQKQYTLIEKIKEELQEKRKYYQSEWKNGTIEQRDQITRRIYQQVLKFDQPESFIAQMEIVFANLPLKLRARNSAVTLNEILWCCLFLLETPTDIMCAVLNFKPTSLYKFKQRLYKKLGYDSAKSFEVDLENGQI